MSKEKWFLGHVSRQVAEDAITSCGKDGSFVIRSSESVVGAYALSVYHSKQVHTYRILQTSNNMLAVQTLNGVQQRKFCTLDDLVKEYRDPQNGLVCGLTIPVGLSDTYQSTQPLSLDLPSVSRPESSSLSTAISTALSSTPFAILPLPRTKASPIPATKASPTPIATPRQYDNSNLEKQKDSSTTRLFVLPPLPQRDTSQRPPATNKKNMNETSDVNVENKLLSRFSEVKAVWTGTNDAFLESVHHYATGSGFESDVNRVRNGGEHCTELQTLLAKEAVAFQRELETFLMKTDILRQLFDSNLMIRKAHNYNRINNLDVDLDTFLIRLRDCQTVVKALNKRACFNIQSLLGLPPRSSTNRKLSRVHEVITERVFEVKQEGGLKFSKQKLKLDLLKGTLAIIKSDDVVKYNHKKVLQIIKNNKAKNKLSIVLDGFKKKDYTFEESSQREAFCQLLQYIRNKNKDSPDVDSVSVFCGSWNMGDAMPPNDISSWFMCNGSGKCLDFPIQSVPHDIYVIGIQEAGLQERDLMHKVIETLQEITGASFHLVVMDALWHIKIIVIVKEEHKNRISHVQTSTVKTGIANALGNKGAVAVSFQYECTSFCFINAHLTSGSEKCARRNQNYHDIIRSLNLGEDRFSIFDLTNRFDHLFFFGDLNYRLEMEATEILDYIKKNELPVLTKVDQLKQERDSNKVFSRYSEDEILFPPTYRFERGTREKYSIFKVKKTGVRVNVPSWCDRVLWRSYPETHNVCQAYGCTNDIMTSDHSPVFSSFQVGVRGQYVSNEEITSASGSTNQADITFDKLEVVVKSPGKSFFYLQFHSLCLERFVKSSRNSKLMTTDVAFNHVRLTWNSEALPKLHPIISDRAFLIDQHLLICLRNDDDNEVIGECVVALKTAAGTFQERFDVVMTKKGEDIGLMSGEMTVNARKSQRRPREKTYDFIQIRKDDDEAKTKKDVVAEGTYSGVDDIQPPSDPSKQRPPMRSPQRAPVFPNARINNVIPDVGVYRGNAEMCTAATRQRGELIEENQYADPDEVKAGFNSPAITPTSGIQSFSFSKSPDETPPLPAPRSKNEVDKNYESVFTKVKSAVGPGSLSPTLLHPGSPQPSKRPVKNRRPLSAISLHDGQDFPAFEQSGTKSGTRTPPHFTPGSHPSSSPPTHASPVHSSKPRFQEQSAESSYDRLASAEPSYDRLDTAMQFRGNISASNEPRQFRPPVAAPSPFRCQLDEVRNPPSSVEEFLSLLNMSQYTSNLEGSGWDSVEFLGELTEDDLYECGVVDLEHCQIILDAVQALNV